MICSISVVPERGMPTTKTGRSERAPASFLASRRLAGNAAAIELIQLSVAAISKSKVERFRRLPSS